MISINEIQNRRQRSAEFMADTSIAILPAATELTRSNDTEYPFRQNSGFWYFTAFPEPDAWLLIEKTEQHVTSH